jgi:hypothetical protein
MRSLSGRISDVDDWQLVRDALQRHGVQGAEDLGYFANNPQYFRPSRLDERAAMPVLLDLLPALSDQRVVAACAAHLRRPWARPIAFGPLRDAFEQWAPQNLSAGWQLGNALANAASAANLPVVLSLAAQTQYGTARQMIVDALWRFRKSALVEPALIALIRDPDVALHAMTALRRAIGRQAALPHLRAVQAEYPRDPLGQAAVRQIRKAEVALRDQTAKRRGGNLTS